MAYHRPMLKRPGLMAEANFSPRRRQALWAGVIQMAAVIGYFWPAASLQGTFMTPGVDGSDLNLYYLPFRNFLGECLRRFQLPLWTPDIFCGFPAHADGQGGFFYPLNMALFALLPAYVALNYVVILTFWQAAFFTYLYCRLIGVSWFSGIIGGLVFAFSGVFVTHLQHVPMINSMSWLPLLLYFLERARIENRMKWVACAGGIWALQLLAGHPQHAYYGGLLAAGYIVLRGTSGQNLLHLARARTLALTLFLATGLGLAAVQILPMMELRRESVRRETIPAALQASFAYKAEDLALFWKPFKYGDPADGTFHKPGSMFWEISFYVGRAILPLAFLALLFRQAPRWLKWFMALTVSVALLFAFSHSLGLNSHFNKWLPGFGFFRVHQRSLYCAVFAVVVMAAHGLDLVGRLSKGARPVLLPGLAVWMMWDVAQFGRHHNPVVDSKTWVAKPETARFLHAQPAGRLLVFYDHRIPYAAAGGWTRDLTPYVRYRNMLHPDSNMLYHLPAIIGHSGLFVERNVAMHDGIIHAIPFRPGPHKDEGDIWITPAVSTLLDAVYCRYIVATFNVHGEGVSKVFSTPYYPGLEDIKVYARTGDVPFAYLASQVVVVSSATALPALLSGGVDLRTTAILEDVVSENLPRGSGAAGGLVTTSRPSPSVIRLRVNALARSVLVVKESFYPGWRAYVDGEEVPVMRANAIFMSAMVPVGEHQITFCYTPPSFYLGAAVSGTTLLAGLILWVVRKQRPPSDQIIP